MIQQLVNRSLPFIILQLMGFILGGADGLMEARNITSLLQQYKQKMTQVKYHSTYKVTE